MGASLSLASALLASYEALLQAARGGVSLRARRGRTAERAGRRATYLVSSLTFSAPNLAAWVTVEVTWSMIEVLVVADLHGWAKAVP